MPNNHAARMLRPTSMLFSGLLLLLFSSRLFAQSEWKIGIVGCDTSHVTAFTKLINDPAATGPLAHMKVVAAYPGGSPDIPSSIDRVEGFTQQLREAGVQIVDKLEDLNPLCDAFLLESVDGRVHWKQFQAIAHGKPVFIDKPAAGSLADLLAIQKLALETGTPWFTSSALRFCDQSQGMKQLIQQGNLGNITGAETCSPYKTEPHHPDLFWYGIHGVESLFTLLGPDCESVSCVESLHCVATGRWKDGRTGTFRGLHDPSSSQAYRWTLYGEKEIHSVAGFSGYGGLVQQIGLFFESGKPPVSAEESIQMFAFMEAAQESKRLGGQSVTLQWALDQAKQQNEKR